MQSGNSHLDLWVYVFSHRLTSFAICLTPDQHVQTLLQTSVLGGAPCVAGDREWWQVQAAGPSHLPHPQLHQTHHVSVLPPTAQRALQTGAAVLRWGTGLVTLMSSWFRPKSLYLVHSSSQKHFHVILTADINIPQMFHSKYHNTSYIIFIYV